jgi:excisionase family DNA binding protein
MRINGHDGQPDTRETPVEPLLLRPIECAKATGLGRSYVYDLIRRGEIPSVRIGRSVRVPAHQLRAWIDALIAAQQPPAVGS